MSEVLVDASGGEGWRNGFFGNPLIFSRALLWSLRHHLTEAALGSKAEFSPTA